MKIKVSAAIIGYFFVVLCDAQDLEEAGLLAPQAFHSTRIINAHSATMLPKRVLDFRVVHRFGDIGGDAGGRHTLYGIEASTDIRIAFEYGLTGRINLGLGRSKGAGPQRELFDGYAKVSLLRQTEGRNMPLSLCLLAASTYSDMVAVDDETSPVSFRKRIHRLTYAGQVIMSRRFSDRFSLALLPTVNHRNFVAFADSNIIFSTGAAARYRISKVTAIVVEYFHVFNPNYKIIDEAEDNKYRNSLSVGAEFNTGGHVFNLVLTNSAGIVESQYISSTYSDWARGEIRLGFTISRIFKL